MISIDGLCTDSDIAHSFDYNYLSVLNNQNKFVEMICFDGAAGHEISNIYFDEEKNHLHTWFSPHQNKY